MRTRDRSLCGWEESPKESRLKAAQMLADADVAVAAWVDLWNKQEGFRTWISVAEFSLRYGIPERTVSSWCKSGELPAVMKNDRYRINVSELDED
jgi:excisionase family DNA binding protein